MTDWLSVSPGDVPLVVSIPHAGTIIPDDISGLLSLDLARRDADHHVDRLYAFAADLGATIIDSRISRTVIDLNRDPSGQSLYPGQVTTGLCPTSTFDGEPLYVAGSEPDAEEINRRRVAYFAPYHAALRVEIERLRGLYPAIVLYDAHSIRSHVPRLFDGELPQFNIGSYDAASCAPALTDAIAANCAGDTYVVNGRFKGGWITRHYGEPERGINAVQMELAIRGYADEDGAWPPSWDAARNAPMQAKLHTILNTCLDFAKAQQ
jgi:N-formylglutamate deformylase